MTSESTISLKDRWEIRKDKALTFAAIVTPFIVAIIGGNYSANIKESENRIRYVELAITQLRTTPSPETAALRDWALELLDSQSPIKLPPAAKDQLKAHAFPVALSGAASGAALASGTATVIAGKATASKHSAELPH